MIQLRIVLSFVVLYFFCTTTIWATAPNQQRHTDRLPLAKSYTETSTMPPPAQKLLVNRENLAEKKTTLPQQDEIKKKNDLAEAMTAQGAWIRSAIIPAWGQIRNEHYWKVPVIYTVFAGMAWGGIYNHLEYVKEKRKILRGNRYIYSRNYINECRRNRDICVILAVLWYIANIFDAYVGASLKTFDLSDDISLKIQPTPPPSVHDKLDTRFSLSLRL